MTAIIESETVQHQRQPIDSAQISKSSATPARSSQGEITSCYCISKDFTISTVYLAKDVCPGELLQMIIEIDNTHCRANISTISIRSQGHATSDSGSFFNKQINGVYAGQSLVGNDAIKEQFVMPKTVAINPKCSGKLLSCQYSLNRMLNHDITCSCCSNIIGSGIPIIIQPSLFIICLRSPRLIGPLKLCPSLTLSFLITSISTIYPHQCSKIL